MAIRYYRQEACDQSVGDVALSGQGVYVSDETTWLRWTSEGVLYSFATVYGCVLIDHGVVRPTEWEN